VNLADKILMRPVGALVPYASNSRTHTPAQIDNLCRSLKEFGFTNPILVDGENGIIAGHARLAAAQKLGLAEVPTIDLSWLTPAQRQAYVIGVGAGRFVDPRAASSLMRRQHRRDHHGHETAGCDGAAAPADEWLCVVQPGVMTDAKRGPEFRLV
jgi:hypothetical protein